MDIIVVEQRHEDTELPVLIVRFLNVLEGSTMNAFAT